MQLQGAARHLHHPERHRFRHERQLDPQETKLHLLEIQLDPCGSNFIRCGCNCICTGFNFICRGFNCIRSGSSFIRTPGNVIRARSGTSPSVACIRSSDSNARPWSADGNIPVLTDIATIRPWIDFLRPLLPRDREGNRRLIRHVPFFVD
jgi:hypothetical protein